MSIRIVKFTAQVDSIGGIEIYTTQIHLLTKNLT